MQNSPNRLGGVVKDEFPVIPRPMEGLNDAGPPPFLTKTYEFVEDPATNHVVSWSRGNNSFVIWDPQKFSTILLPKYFKHNNFSSFVRQLNTYGFRKVDPDRWEFANEGFLRGKKTLLKNIRRRKSCQSSTQSSSSSSASSSQHLASLDPACVELGRFGLDGEIDRLRRDKHVLMAELVKLRQQQQSTKSHLQSMENRLRKTELKQQHMMNFLARAMQNPTFMQRFVQEKGRRKDLVEAIKRKRRRSIEHSRSTVDDHVEALDDIDDDLGQSGIVKIEPRDYSINGFGEEVEGFDEAISIDMQGLVAENVGLQEEELGVEQGLSLYRDHDHSKEFDNGFWKNLLNENMEDILGVDHEEDDDPEVDVLAEELGNYLASSPK